MMIIGPRQLLDLTNMPRANRHFLTGSVLAYRSSMQRTQLQSFQMFQSPCARFKLLKTMGWEENRV